MAQLILIVDLELLGCLRVLVGLAHGCLILRGMLIISVIVVILRAGRRVFGENRTLNVLQGAGFCVFNDAARRDLPVAITMAGGYGRDIDVTVDIHLQTIQLAAVAFGARRDSCAADTLRSANFI